MLDIINILKYVTPRSQNLKNANEKYKRTPLRKITVSNFKAVANHIKAK